MGSVGSVGRGSGDDIYGLRQMRDGDDPRDIYWRKSTMANSHILRERSRETRPDIELLVDTVKPTTADEQYSTHFEKRIREVASRAVAHIKRGDSVLVGNTVGDRVRADRNLGSDPILRVLALLESVSEKDAQAAREQKRGAMRSPVEAPPPPAPEEPKAEAARS